jgi:hypothetical protein
LFENPIAEFVAGTVELFNEYYPKCKSRSIPGPGVCALFMSYFYFRYTKAIFRIL